MLRSLIAALYAVLLGFRFRRELAISVHELQRYLSKSFNLGLCYGAFVKPPTIRGSVYAGRAAFLCCAYDVVTDWRSFSPYFRERFKRQLQRLVPEWAVGLTMQLYRSDLEEALQEDGLERGIIAVKLITGVVGSEDSFSGFGIRRLGLLLQIVDDVIDFEHDVAHEELNCLATSRGTLHLRFLKENKQQLLHLFRGDLVMRSVITHGIRRGEAMAQELS